MLRYKLFKNLITCSIRNRSSQIDFEKLEQESKLNSSDFANEEAKLLEETILQRRNKSRLREGDRNILMDKNPYPEPQFFHHGSLKYLRRTYGRYGEASGINPSICWPIKEELDIVKEYEMVKYPFTIPEMIAKVAKDKKEKQDKILARQEDIIKKINNLEGWKQDMYNRIAKKEADAKAAKQKKERLVEEVRRHFGYSVDPKDEKFQEMLAKKEKEQKKTLKEERRKQKEAKMMDQLYQKKRYTATSDTEQQEVSNKNKTEE